MIAKMEARESTLTSVLVLLLLSLGTIFMIMAPSTLVVFGVDTINTSVRVNFSNQVPWVTNVMIDDSILVPAGEIDLVPDSFVNVWCNGTVHDPNGAGDIARANATLYHQSVQSTSSQFNSTRYFDSSCYNHSQDATSISFMCNFSIMYYAWNGTWFCNMTGIDQAGRTAYNDSSTYINSLYALDVPGIIDYGNMQVNTNSSSELPKNVTNVGNMVLDLDLYGFARVLDDGYAMNCTGGGAIPIGNQFFDTNTSNNFIYQKTNLSGLQAAPNQVDVDVDVRNDSVGNDYTGYTDWKIYVPFGASGWCNGTVVFSGVPDTYN